MGNHFLGDSVFSICIWKHSTFLGFLLFFNCITLGLSESTRIVKKIIHKNVQHTPTINILPKLIPVVWPFFEAKKENCVLNFFKVGLELLRSCLRIIFGLQIPIFMRTLCLKGWYMTPKIKVLGPMLALWEDQFDYVSGEKPIILGFLQKRILECNRSCLPLGGFFWP